MIASVDPGKVLFLSVGLDDGSMEAFEDINDAVAHASALVEQGGVERGIFVAVPRARVHSGVRVDPIDPPVIPVSMPVSNDSVSEASSRHKDWVKAQAFGAQPNGRDESSH